MKTMFKSSLQPKRAVLAVLILFLLVGVFGLAAAAGQAGQTQASTPASTNKVGAQTPSVPPKTIQNPPPQGSGERPKTAPTKAPGPQPARTTTTVIAPAAPAKPISKPSPVRVSSKPSGKAPASAVEAKPPQETTPSILLSNAAGRRDPFKAWVVPGPVNRVAAGAVSGTLPAGIRGLVISELRLEGTVRQEPANSMIAVVTNNTKRAYFLRLNDTLYNGVVSKITPEAVYFKENTLDSSGRVATHEVELKVGLAPGEGR
jgi:hypothetical protein